MENVTNIRGVRFIMSVAWASQLSILVVVGLAWRSQALTSTVCIDARSTGVH